MTDEELITLICNEAEEKIKNGLSENKVVYLIKSSGLLRLSKDSHGNVYIVGAGNSEYLKKQSAEIARRLNIKC